MRSVEPLTDRSRGFTLIEALVAIGVVAVLLAILAPTAGEARMIARENAVLAHQREVAAELRRYTTDRGGWYPYYGVPGTAEAPIDYPPRLQNPEGYGGFDPNGLYWGQPLAWWWKLEIDGYNGALARRGPEVDPDWDVQERPYNAAALDWMMYAAFAKPRFFDGVTPASVEDHAPMPEHSVAHPGGKGLLLRWNAVRRTHDVVRWKHSVHFVDGHGRRTALDSLRPGIDIPSVMEGMPVLMTKDGVLGRDR